MEQFKHIGVFAGLFQRYGEVEGFFYYIVDHLWLDVGAKDRCGNHISDVGQRHVGYVFKQSRRYQWDRQGHIYATIGGNAPQDGIAEPDRGVRIVGAVVFHRAK